MRGTPYSPCLFISSKRITPAYAGNTGGTLGKGRMTEDHPRLCGEHQTLEATNIEKGGSPPLMRGTQVSTSKYYIEGRITPAYAGNTWKEGEEIEFSWDHPRLCGEHQIAPVKWFKSEGSPPLMRGTRNKFCRNRQNNRITPAYAGNTGKEHLKAYRYKDHPRLCGEHISYRYCPL